MSAAVGFGRPAALAAEYQSELHKQIAQRCFNEGLRAGQEANAAQLRRANHEIHQLRITVAQLKGEQVMSP